MRKILAGLAIGAAAYAFSDLDGSYVLPQDHLAIGYKTAPLADRVAAFQRPASRKQSHARRGQPYGYLAAALKAFDVPVSSQLLVFSKTSFQGPRISPRAARALYFNDDTFVGWVPEGEVLELASVDPRAGRHLLHDGSGRRRHAAHRAPR